MKRNLILSALIGAMLLPLFATSADAGWWRRGREELRDRGSIAGKVIAVTRRGDALRADVLVYANLLEARVSCVTLSDLDRVQDKLPLGQSLYVLSTGEMTEDGCSVARLWRPVGKSPKADAIVGIRHAIAVWLYGVRYPDRMQRFIGDGERQLKMDEIRKLAASTPDIIEAFRVWGIDLTDFGESRDRIDELERENEQLRQRLEEFERGGLAPSRDLRLGDPVTRWIAEAGACHEDMGTIHGHAGDLQRVVRHVAGAKGGAGHHPGLEAAVAGIVEITKPYQAADLSAL